MDLDRMFALESQGDPPDDSLLARVHTVERGYNDNLELWGHAIILSTELSPKGAGVRWIYVPANDLVWVNVNQTDSLALVWQH